MLRRFEMKYVIPPTLVRPIRTFIQPYTVRDHFLNGRSRDRYPITSVYFDSPDMRLAAGTLAGDRDRVKLRIRSYTPLGAVPSESESVFVEIKRKRSAVVHKSRGRLPLSSARDLFRSAGESAHGPLRWSAFDSAVREFGDLCRLYRARPVANVHYFREPYESRHGDDVRITFDYELRTSPAQQGAWFENGGQQDVPVAGVIFEIKFTDVLPRWAADLVRRFDLRNRSVPKYVLSVQRAGQNEYPHLAWLRRAPLRELG